MKQSTRRLITSLGIVLALAGCSPQESGNSTGPIPPKSIPDENTPPVKQEATCDAVVSLRHGQMIAPTDALRKSRAFLVRSFASFIATTSPDDTRRFMGIKGTLYPVPGDLETSSALFTAVCLDTPMKSPEGAVVVKQIIPRPEIRIWNNNEYQAFMAYAPESIWADGTLDGALVPTLEWNLGTGWRVTLTASLESMRADLFSLKKHLDRQVFGGKGSLEIYEGTEVNAFVLVYTIDARVNGKPVKVRNELEYVGI